MGKDTENGNGLHLPAGTLLQGGKYRIIRFIGSGGFGCTYEAEHTGLGERVAIKEFFVRDFCNRDGENSRISVGTESKRPLVEKLLKKFMEEAKSLYRLRHPGIVRVSDVFEENGTAYYVMDYIDGRSLQEIVKTDGPLPEERALKYIRQVSEALSYVHSNNRLHLDIKPGNIMVDGNDHAVLIDFGASKQYDEASGENTSTLMGRTPGYAPPEQMSNRVGKFLPATDIYALGATMYKCLTGETPLDSSDLISGEILFPLPAGISTGTRRAVSASMELNKGKRPQSIDEFLSLLPGSVQGNVTESVEPEETEYFAEEKSVLTGETVNPVQDVRPSLPQEHGWVDLGLSVNWATCNVGATSPSDYGDYYAWGETSTKPSYTEDNSRTSGKKMDDISGDIRYDAARANWGGDWRMPTQAEMDELEGKCRWRWTSRDGVDGFMVTGPSGLSIFLPSCGYVVGDSSVGSGTECSYWSSSPSVSDNRSSYCQSRSRKESGHVRYRHHGSSVRPVRSEPAKSGTVVSGPSAESVASGSAEAEPKGRGKRGALKWAVVSLCILAGLAVGIYLIRPSFRSGDVSGYQRSYSYKDSVLLAEKIRHKRDSIRRVEEELRESEASARREAAAAEAAMKRMQDSIAKVNREREAREELLRQEQARREDEIRAVVKRKQDSLDRIRRLEEERLWRSKAYMRINKVDFGPGVNSDQILYFSNTVEGADISYLNPRINYDGMISENKNVTLQVKIYDPDGSLEKYADSPAGYTYSTTITVHPGKANSIILTGWGNESSWTYDPGKYLFELWFEGEKIYSQNFVVSASKPSARIDSLWVDHGYCQDNTQGMLVHVRFRTYGLKDKSGRVTVYFEYEDGNPLKDTNGLYCTVDGSVAVGESFTPSYDSSIYSDFDLFMPYSEMEMHVSSGEYDLKLMLQVKSEGKLLASSDYYYFIYTQN